VNKSSDDGDTPLCIACENGHCEVVDALLRKKADVNKAGSDGITPLAVARRNGHWDVVDALLDGAWDEIDRTRM
jgi:ankyrin repeat protein